MNPKYKKIFEPIQVGHMTVKNRIEVAPMAPRLAYNEGTVSPELLAWTKEMAKGGAGIVTVGITMVTPLNGMSSSACLNLGDDRALTSLTTLAEEVHRYGAKASIELAGFAMGHDMPVGKSPIDMMTQEDIDAWIELFANAAERAYFCGMDMVLLHGGHGILISNFFSPLFNHREDKYGGSIENRARFACELTDAIRAKTKGKLAIEFRLSADELTEGGVVLEDTLAFAQILQDQVDLIHVSAGMLLDDSLVPYVTQPIYLKRGYNVHYAASVKKSGIKVPVTTVGSIDLDTAAEILERGDADICAMARSSLADPFGVEKVRLGKEDEVTPCIRCVVCLDRTHGFRGKRVACAVNPRCGREVEDDIARGLPYEKQKVVIIGGGPAGMQAARTASERGHEVVLYEKSDKLGGALHMAIAADFKADLKRYLDWAIRMTQFDPNITIKYNTEATPELINAEAPDALIVAVGAEPNLPPIPGIDGPNVVWVGEVESGTIEVADEVVIAGGGLTGCEAALDLANKGKKVTIVEMVSEAAMLHVAHTPMTALVQLLKAAGVMLLTEHKVASIGENSVIVESADGQKEIPFGTLIISLGVKSKKDEANQFAGLTDKVIMIGDCNTNQGTVFTATKSGYDAVFDL